MAAIYDRLVLRGSFSLFRSAYFLSCSLISQSGLLHPVIAGHAQIQVLQVIEAIFAISSGVQCTRCDWGGNILQTSKA